MNNELSIFSNPEFGKVRVVTRDGEPWFVANDVCACLSLDNCSEAIRSLDADEKATLTQPDSCKNSSGLRSGSRLVNESGLYALIFKSQKEEAKKFRKWITSEVLPQIRKTGSYSAMPKDYASALRALADEVEKREALESENRGLYSKNTAMEEALGIAEHWKQIKALDWVTEIFDTSGRQCPVWSQLGKKAVAISRALQLEYRQVPDSEFSRVGLYQEPVLKTLHAFVLNNPGYLSQFRKKK